MLALASQNPSVDLTYFPQGMADLAGVARENSAVLSSTRPPGIKKAPDLPNMRYGVIRMGGREYFLAVSGAPDSEDGDPYARVFLDGNRDGDLTTDPLVVWNEWRSVDTLTGRSYVRGEARAYVRVLLEGREVWGAVLLTGWGRPNLIDARCDYGYYGTAPLDGKRHRAAVYDLRGTYQNLTEDRATGRLGGFLLVDLNDNGSFRSERYLLGDPFPMGGKWYRLEGPGGDLRLVTVDRTDPAPSGNIPEGPPEAFKVGDAAPTFVAHGADRSTIRFPEDYKGKLVLLNFQDWATNYLGDLAKGYQALHSRGLEIVSVWTEVEERKWRHWPYATGVGAVWAHVFGDDAFTIQKLYGTNYTPMSYLVDGDTGKILAKDQSLYGNRLVEAVEKALRERGRHDRPTTLIFPVL